MATLVLTTVGGALGGPVGAMLGGLLGQSVDRELFKPKGRVGPRLTELKLQTSSYGTPLPKLFGTLRVAGSVIWATDLIEHSHRQGGKGRPTTTSYSYSASFAVALSARPIVGVGRIWADGKLLRGAAGDWKAATGFRLHLGDEDQAVDPLIASAEGLNLTPAHRGIAYAVFEDLDLADYGNRIPSLTFEVMADTSGVDAGRIVRELSAGLIEPAGASVAIGGYSAYGDTRRAVIDPLVQASGAWPMARPGGLSLVSDEGPTETVADVGMGGGGDGVARRSIAAADRGPRRVTIGHYDPDRDYQAGLQQAMRPGAGQRVETIELPAVLTAAHAKRLAQATLARADIERETRTVTTGWDAMRIAPGARIEIAGEPGQWRVARWSLERMAVTLDLVRIAPAPLPTSATPGRVMAAPDAIVGTTVLHAFELPHLGEGLPTAARLSIAACGTSPGWRRAALSMSVDGGGRWEGIGSTAAPAIVGMVEQPAGTADPGIEDRRSALVIELAHGAMQLRDADDVTLDAGGNLALVGDELLQFGEAQPLGGARWRLTRLWRGRRGTEAAVGQGAVGERFVLIETQTLLQQDLPPSEAGIVHIMAAGVSDAVGIEAEAVRTNASRVPPSPVALRMEAIGDDGIRLRWVRRSRSGWRWIDGADVPLGEEREHYHVRLSDAGGERRIEVDVAELVIDNAARADGPITVEIRQAGDHGLSPPAFITIPSIEERP